MSASKGKGSSGSKPPASELQGRFDQLFKDAGDKEKAWAEFLKWTLDQSKNTGARVTTEASPGNPSMVTAESAMIMSYIGRLGITLAKIEKRLVNIEKSVERLNLKIQ